jgi:hypothetical protein
MDTGARRVSGAPGAAFDNGAHLMQHAEQGGDDRVLAVGQATMSPRRAT